jgi:phosphoglycerate dehydrogenase-like enzyme
MIFLDNATNREDIIRVANKLGNSECVYTHFTKLNYKNYENLKFVLCPCTDIRHLEPGLAPEDTKFIYLTDKNVLFEKVVSSAEWVVWSLLRLLKYDLNAQEELHHKSIGFVGFGRMMQRVAKMLSGCRVTMYYYDNDAENYYLERAQRCADVNNIYLNCDIVVIGLSQNKQTMNFVDIDSFQLMKEGKRPYFLNNSRSSIVNGEALVNAITSNVLRGCALDVIEDYTNEVKTDLYRLVYKKNLIITPHIAGKGIQSRINTDKIILDIFKKEVLRE